MRRFKIHSRLQASDVPCEYVDEQSTGESYCMRKEKVINNRYQKGCIESGRGSIGYGEECPFSEDENYNDCRCNPINVNKRFGRKK